MRLKLYANAGQLRQTKEASMAQAAGFSRTQIALHWLIAVLVILQFVFHESVVGAFDAALEGKVPDMTALVWGHLIGGTVILLLVLWRLQVRMTRGAPALPDGSPVWLVLASRVGHLAFYVLLILLPLTGIVAWYGGVEVAGDAHGLLRIGLFFLVAAHVLGALFHLIIRRDGVMQRMFRAG
jgi:cytochrome b561